ncbi:DUF2087 domain-containing protein [Paenactinomyces guangxiensis]|uniref:Metalloregulator ArsR/SmtB family transcription factor n=1 Tax=Paenactinomyces guangxiensis TaxID=1490290 RepID=A0A7W1WPP2_9BACL|nr:metalloregulator ArsR/SmtB family transcription factor [Paenactinomyces guangxiensis]MBA4493765.1 metalloregulator ArsR/SmtB family transcription factor [Paenactinomyces guangxiensis]MBH8591053.1 metalloregulator ArsR/SmtB family transcription factor [Paenactinomyces guangxiensis]
MQLERLIAFHKALADPVRIRILCLLSSGPLHGQALAGKLGVKPPTITHHMGKLREAGLVKEKREKNTIYFHLDMHSLERKSQATLQTILHQTKGYDQMDENKQKYRREVLKNFFTAEGKLKNIPAQRKKKLIVFEEICKGLKMGEKYPEKVINEHIKQYFDDYATIRRELIVNKYMYREDGFYELNPKEMWSVIE